MQHNNNAYITIPNALNHDKATYAIKVNLNSSTEPLHGHTTTSAYTIKANLSSPTGGVEGASPQPVFHRPYGARRHVHGTLDVAVSEAGEGQHKEKRVVWRQPPVALLYGGYVFGHQRAAVFNGCLKVGFLPFGRVSSADNLLISPLSQSYYCRSLLPERVELAAQAANLSLVLVFRQAQLVYLLSVSVG